MQTVADAERILTMGAAAERVHVTGSLKATANVTPAPVPPLPGLASRPLLVAASTQPGEEQFVLNACAGVWTRYPDALLLLAPRRPERFDEAVSCAERARVVVARRTTSHSVDPSTRVLVLDTVGELVHYLPFAVAVFVGGTIAPLGGHNVLEPATFGKPVSFGPHTDTVAEPAAALLAAGGAVRVETPNQLTEHWLHCLDHPAAAREMGARGQGVAAAGAAALERTWALIEPYLGAA
jgi:3-deoxy-D-manno-octulosonic-acid transferase